MNMHLAEISKCVTAGAIALLVVDGAGWHRSSKLVAPENIVLLKLPPYAPELNPTENAWNSLMRAPDIVRAIATRHWAQVRT